MKPQTPAIYKGPYNYVYELPQEPDRTDPYNVGIKILKFTPETKELVTKYPDEYREVMMVEKRVTNILLAGSFKNLHGQLKQFGKLMPNGPYYMDGRDGVMNIHNKMSNRPVCKVYTFAGGNGELLSFSVKSKFVKSSVELSKTSEVDPDTKDVITTSTQVLNNQDAANPDGYVSWRDFLDKYPAKADATRTVINAPVNDIFPRGGTIDTSVGHSNIQVNTDYLKDQVNYTRNKAGIPVVPTFHSFADAVTEISAQPDLTQAEVDAYIKQLKERWEYIQNPQKESEMDDAIHYMNYLPNFTITRRVRIVKETNASVHDPKPQLRNPGSFTTVGYGYKNLSDQLKSEESSAKRGFEHLKKKSGISILSTTPVISRNAYGTSYTTEIKVKYLEEMDIEIPINGALVLSSEWVPLSGAIMTNDIEDRIDNQVTADATVVGDPFLESSMNIQIQNVSLLYSGVWYTKKVSHKINSSGGYTCDINFTQRDIPYSVNRIEGRLITNKAMAEINDEANKAIVTGSYKRVPQLTQWLKAYSRNFPGYSLIAVGTSDPNQIAIYKAKADFVANKTDSDIVDYIDKSKDPSQLQYKEVEYIGTTNVNQIL